MLGAREARFLHALSTAALVSAVGWADQPTPFSEEAVARGVDYHVAFGQFSQAGSGCGVALCDLDGDGDADLIATGAADKRVGIWSNNGAGVFTRVGQADPALEVPAFSGVVAGDYDGDGDLDVYLSSWTGQDRLLRNDGAFSFVDVTAAAGITHVAKCTGAAFGDLNGDGWLDLYNGGYQVDLVTTSNILYANAGAAGFQLWNVFDTPPQPVFGASIFDFDRDLDQDLYVFVDRGGLPGFANELWRNDGEGGYDNIAAQAGVTADLCAMGLGIGDVDRNGFPDLYVTDSFGNRLFMNAGDGSFSDATAVAGVASDYFSWAAMFWDYDNDGWLDLFVCSHDAPNRQYTGSPSGWPMQDVAPQLALDLNTQSFTCASGDIDGDGDLDLVVSSYDEPLRVYVNKEGQKRNWARFRVLGAWPNHFSVGASIDLRVGQGVQLQQIIAGNNFKSMNEPVAHFGLGDAAVMDEVTIHWPDGATRTLTAYPSNHVWPVYHPALLGDFDLDGVVGQLDLNVLLSCYLATPLTPGCAAMDFDGNAVVNQLDLNQLLAAYGAP